MDVRNTLFAKKKKRFILHIESFDFDAVEIECREIKTPSRNQCVCNI